MVVKKDRKGLVSLSGLNDKEKEVFVKFLKFERERHQEDIDNIDNTIAFFRVKRRRVTTRL